MLKSRGFLATIAAMAVMAGVSTPAASSTILPLISNTPSSSNGRPRGAHMAAVRAARKARNVRRNRAAHR